MIRTEVYGAGSRWWCDQCDELYNERGQLIRYFTHSPPPAACKRCEEQCCLAVFKPNGEPAFVSVEGTRSNIAAMQRTLKEGCIVNPDVARDLKSQMVNHS